MVATGKSMALGSSRRRDFQFSGKTSCAFALIRKDKQKRGEPPNLGNQNSPPSSPDNFYGESENCVELSLIVW